MCTRTTLKRLRQKPLLPPVFNDEPAFDPERERAAFTVAPFDPLSLVAAARAQGQELVAEAFTRCTMAYTRCELYTYFLPPWERCEQYTYYSNYFLAHPIWGTLVVDIFTKASAPGAYFIGGMEYLDKVIGRHMPVDELLRNLAWARRKAEEMQRELGRKRPFDAHRRA